MPSPKSIASNLTSGIAILGWFLVLLLAAAGMLMLFTFGPYSRTPTSADMGLLASDAHLSIGGVPLTLPLIALDSESRRNAFLSGYSEERFAKMAKERAAFAASAASAAAPLKMERTRVRVGLFGLADVDATAWLTICNRLSRDWTRSVCDDPQAPLLQSLPRDGFDLADRQHLDAFRYSHLSIGDLGEAAPILQAMDLTAGVPALACGTPLKPDAPRPCLAAMRIKGDLLTVWFVQDGPDEPALTQARREGQAIAALVTYGLGPVEDFPRLTAAACGTLRPGAGPFQPSDPSWPC